MGPVSVVVFAYSSVVLFCASSLAAAAGVGGGGINVPILMLIYGFSFKRSVVFSSCTLLGSFTSQILVNYRKTHPFKTSRPLIYFEIALILLPAQLGGSNFGSMLVKILPDSVMYVLALCVLLFASCITFLKGQKMMHHEIGHTESNLQGSLLTGESSTTLGVATLSSFEYARSFDSFSQAIHTPISQFRVPQPDDQYLGQSNSSGDLLTPSTTLFPKQVPSVPVRYPWDTIGILVLVWSIYVALLVANGVFDICSLGNTATFLAVYPPLFAGSIYGIYKAAAEQKGNPVSVLIGDIKFDQFDVKPACLVFVVGVLCSLLGIGGGELVGPLLLTLGVIPQVSSATTSFMSFFNTFSILISKGSQDEIDYNVAGFLVAIGFCAGFVGRTAGLWFAEKYKKPSVLVFALVAVLVLSCIFYVFELSSGGFDTTVTNLCAS
jgi:uncharacterized membrane protein YfcA